MLMAYVTSDELLQKTFYIKIMTKALLCVVANAMSLCLEHFVDLCLDRSTAFSLV